MSPNDSGAAVEAIRRFNRLYTKTIGILGETYLDSAFSLTESRIIYELAQHENATASELAKELNIDPGYLSRILRGFEHRGLIAKSRSEIDSRQNLLSLTGQGREAFAELNERSAAEVAALLQSLAPDDQSEIVGAMERIERVLTPRVRAGAAYLLRSHRPGDLGWIVQRHGVLYAKEYGWNGQIEAFTAEVVANFGRNHDATREHCWIAEEDGENIGSVMLVADSPKIARLRLLLVEPQARGLGVGARLVEECVRFAHRAGYEKISLWTHDILVAARRIYAQAGFRLVDAERHDEFGPNLVGETWERDL